ncbi:ATP synthase subunit I [Halomonas vilamensis]|uniref:ATP synthase subunit I n=1 Tax=Vreelandella vilamensis TaxID=531309 RepID=A0ABU1H3K5_9GAMM|nr:ATP synthase subunit I [Halomonas vilamensis]MDR5898875.1 ATP synthase subunit I [Halomonas vilamensis]
MKKKWQRREVTRRQTYLRRLSIAQAGIALAVVGLALGLAQRDGAISAFLGIVVALLPHAFFVQRSGALTSRTSPSRSAARLFRAEMGKFGLTVVLFVAVFLLVPPSNPAFFFSAYVAVVLTHWLTPWLMPKRRSTD